jgi:hypothetical protein
MGQAMKAQYWLTVVVTAALIGGAGQAQERRLFGRQPCPPPCECVPGTMPAEPSKTTEPSAMPPQSNAFNEALASAGEAGTQPATSYMPGMFGDIIGGQVRTVVNLGGSGLTPVAMPNPSQNAGFKIAENESPRPTNRFYYNYNFFGNVDVSVGQPVPFLQVHRHTIGFEKTVLGENASIGLRLPFLSLGGDPGYSSQYVGDLSVIMKAAIINNQETGNLLSVGLVIGTPTGETPSFPGGRGQRLFMPRIFDVILQPFFGYIYNLSPDWYVHGFHSVSVPTDFNDVTFMSNDVGIGYWLYRNDEGILKGIIPTAEIHINTPFTHRDITANLFMIDQSTLTGGVTFAFARSTLGGAVGVPFNGPHQIEAVATCTIRY